MSNINTLLLVTAFILPVQAQANEEETPIKFPIVEKQYPDLQRTIKRPTIVWSPKTHADLDESDGKAHIISPFFYYQQENTEKN